MTTAMDILLEFKEAQALVPRQLCFPFDTVCCAVSCVLGTWIGDFHDEYHRDLSCGGWCESIEQWRWKFGGDA